MPQAVTMGATLQCTFGVAPSALMVTPENHVLQTTPVANIMDHIPIKNILPFAMCTSLANPMVAAATTAAFGVLTPMPCIPMTMSPWIPGSVTVLIGNMPTLNNTCKLMCNWAGGISVVNPGQIPVQVK